MDGFSGRATAVNSTWTLALSRPGIMTIRQVRTAPQVVSSFPCRGYPYKDTDGPGQASEVRFGTSSLTFRARFLVLASTCVGLSAWTTPFPTFLPRQDTGRSGRSRKGEAQSCHGSGDIGQNTLQVFGSPGRLHSSEASQCPLLPGTMVFFTPGVRLVGGSVTSLPCASYVGHLHVMSTQ